MPPARLQRRRRVLGDGWPLFIGIPPGGMACTAAGMERMRLLASSDRSRAAVSGMSASESAARSSDETHSPMHSGGSRAKVILSGSGWQLLAQVAPLVVNLALTPYVIGALGAVAYGLWLVASALTSFFGQFDGGIQRSAHRYFALYAGRNDRMAATRLLVSLLLCIGVIAGCTLVPAFVASPWVADFFHAPPALHDDMVVLLRVLVVLVALGLARNLFAGVLFAHQRFVVTATTTLIGYAVYATVMVLTLSRGWGLRGAALAFVLQAVVATVLIVPSALRYLTRSGIGLISRAQLREFVGFAWRVQVSGLLTMLSFQGVMLLVGRLRPQDMPGFGPGATFAQQLRIMPTLTMRPIQSLLGQAVGARGAAGAVGDFADIQRVWVRTLCGWGVIGAPAAYYGVNLWLPLETDLPGQVAAAMLIAHVIALLPQALVQWLMLVGRPGYEMWSSFVNVVIILGLSAWLVPQLGVLAVPLAAIVANLLSLVVVTTLARRLPVRVPSPVRGVPWLWVVLGGVTASLLTTLMQRFILAQGIPQGPISLLLSALAAAPVAIGYALICLNMWATVRRWLNARRA